MAYIRKRSVYKRKRSYRKRSMGRVQRPLRTVARAQTYPFSRFVNAQLVCQGSDAIPSIGTATLFQLQNVPNYTEFTTLFDQYKIAGVAYRWVMDTDPMVQTTKKFPCLRWVHDYDDVTSPGDLTVLQQYPKMREFWFTESKQCTPWNYIKPARAAIEYESAVLSSYRPQWKGFIDCASYTAPHYGIKAYYDYLQTGVRILLQCKYYMVFKNVR